jgi:DNA polymerase-3 subunit delta
MRPPVFGPRRDIMQRQAQSLGLRRIEEALAMLIETDLTLRSSSRAPAEALMERTLIRVAMLARR